MADHHNNVLIHNMILPFLSETYKLSLLKDDIRIPFSRDFHICKVEESFDYK